MEKVVWSALRHLAPDGRPRVSCICWPGNTKEPIISPFIDSSIFPIFLILKLLHLLPMPVSPSAQISSRLNPLHRRLLCSTVESECPPTTSPMSSRCPPPRWLQRLASISIYYTPVSPLTYPFRLLDGSHRASLCTAVRKPSSHLGRQPDNATYALRYHTVSAN